ncbi:MAG: sigma-54-dependent Fis family transcriptional regulator [Spirochaetales bacterium]|nr:sigma-54-dependent Fis family transcriptional regulator [Spirochaetales bacterium]MBQ3696784.1 sigma-54-dependent Fis family transcriptional regulator [Spirochaetales bacterium]MBQ3829352.1 sigma-54-dependent Fis family transcriptional regulator [Spirochaetales bacterium]MBQ6124745.1 sigma-54-dependent Fis family transcriptional regulator [Spirochaetales bacterium]MBQ7728986.1 sigma-54-dependent Fis family transcriptional regulator [Spirochaetales bacterium]
MRILIVDDETNIRDLMCRYMKIEGIEGVGAENAYSAQRILREQPFDGILVDLKMPGMDGYEFVRWVRDEGFRMPIIMMSAHGEISDAVNAMKHGVQDFIVKPFDPEEVIIKLKNLVEAQNFRTLQEMEERLPQERAFIGESVQIRKIKDTISRIASTNSSVLITGESGTGKEVVARSIHEQSTVSSGPFVAINIGGVPENLLESELFGYEKGAFTGATGRKIGMFELANRGTLFLDEIGDMPHALQVKILRVLQEKCITRLGGTEPIPINARIVCATNKDLESLVREGKFREDLFFRLNVVRIHIPPLRERKDDIPLLAAWIIKKLNINMGRHFSGLTPDAMEKLKNYNFYGNIRELENILERAAIFSDGDLISEDNIELRGDVLGHERKPSQESVSTEGMSLKEIEKQSIERALRRWEGNRTKAANELGITRRTLITKIEEYDLDI